MSGERGPRPDASKDKFELVLSSLAEIGAQNAKCAEAIEALVAVISHEKDGMIAAMDDLRTTIQEALEVLEAMRGSGGILSKLLGG